MEKYSVASALIKHDVNKINVMVDIRHIEAKSKEEAMGIYMVEISEQFPEHYVNAHPVALPSYNSDYAKCPSCGDTWDINEHTSCKCGAYISKML